MIDKTHIPQEHLRDLNEKNAQMDPHGFNLGKISNSGRHIHDITEDI